MSTLSTSQWSLSFVIDLGTWLRIVTLLLFTTSVVLACGHYTVRLAINSDYQSAIDLGLEVLSMPRWCESLKDPQGPDATEIAELEESVFT